MTEKQDNILSAALELFANEGFNATSTNQIAKKAGVSEGLIFKHFKNKKGLLDALYAQVEGKLSKGFSHIIFETNPEETLRKTIESPFLIPDADYDFWRLQFKLKWESDYYHPEKMKPIVDKLAWAFKELNYETPEMEAKFLEQIIETIAVTILRQGKESQLGYKDFLLKKLC